MRWLRFYVDEEEKQRLREEARKKKRRSGSKKKAKPRESAVMESLGIPLATRDSWSCYVRQMVIAAYLRAKAALEPGDDGEHESEDDDAPPRPMEIIPMLCPPAKRPLLDDAHFKKLTARTLLGDEGLGPIVDLQRRTEDGAVIEPELVVRTAAMLKKLRKFFPDSRDKVKDTPYDDDDFAMYNVSRALEDVTNDFLEAAKLGYVGAKLVYELD
ncbi:hypothetical protein SELMODRAFT_416759 [Selaginella moellendorffii]|uniref:Uncharacterized protein n=1 Tax=Selaginella moellendorffii TaxID=88036 RepID=D8S0B8_SELML|nr:hypothetical protein SELMODRAFT_416759 [Selaginella moellendorffii]